MSDDPYIRGHQMGKAEGEQAGYRRGIADSKPQSDLGSPESEYERGVQAERERTEKVIFDAIEDWYNGESNLPTIERYLWERLEASDGE